jgi:hypothetical protein
VGQESEIPCATCSQDCRTFKNVRLQVFKWLDTAAPNGIFEDLTEDGLANIGITAVFGTLQNPNGCDPVIAVTQTGFTDSEGLWLSTSCRLPDQDDSGQTEIDPNTGQPFALAFNVCETLPTGSWMENYPLASSAPISVSSVSTNFNAAPTTGTNGAVCWTGSVSLGTGLVTFGNACLSGSSGHGLTLGFWSNKNGQALFGVDDLAAMVTLNLRNADGSAFDPASYAKFRTWLLNATATNMAYMLSAQLAAMKLNTLNTPPGADPNAYIYAPGTTSGGTLGYATIAAVMAEADAILAGTSPVVILDGNPLRARAEAVKNALDRGNNNLNWVGTSATCTAPAPPQ